MRFRKLPLINLIVAVALVPIGAANTQQRVSRITLEQALALFATNSLELQIARARATEALGFARQARSYPNPIAAVEHESVSDGSSLSETETIYAISQQLDWPWRYSHRKTAAQRTADAALAQFQADSMQLAFEIKQAFVEADLAERMLIAAEEVAAVFRQAERSGAARYAEGDISGYGLRRIRVERAGYEVHLRHATVRQAQARRRLSALLVPDSADLLLAPNTPIVGTPPEVDRTRIFAEALHRRPEIDAADLSVEAARATTSLARSGVIPDWNLTAGYKSQSGELNGGVLGLQIPIPFLDRRGGESDAAAARLDAAERKRWLVRRQIENEVSNALDNYTSLQASARLISDTLLAGSDELLEVALASYNEGEMSLLELMDAAVAFREAQETRAHVTTEIWIAYYDLERASGLGVAESAGQGER